MHAIGYSVPELARLIALANFDRLVEDLESQYEETQMRAVRYFGALKGPKAAAALVGRLRVEFFEPVQVALCRAVAEVGAVEALPDLDRLAAGSDDEDVKQAAGEAAKAMRDWAGPVAAGTSTVTLGELRTAAVEAQLLAALSDESAEIRALVADALGRLTSTRAVPALLERLKSDESADVRVAAVEALRVICVAGAVAADARASVVRALADALHDEAMWVQSEAGWAIFKITCGVDEALRTYVVESFFRAVPELLTGKGRPWWVTFPFMMKAVGSETDMVRLTRMILDAPDTRNQSPLAGCLIEMVRPGRIAANPLMIEATRKGVVPWKMLKALAITGDEAAIPLLVECAGPQMAIAIRQVGELSSDEQRQMVRHWAAAGLAMYPHGAALLEAIARDWLGAPEIDVDAVKWVIDALAQLDAGHELRDRLGRYVTNERQ